ncbi:MAG: hypothetical protein L7H04_01255 [Vulcanisaeta sp.]|nr:hypothetical protein [Vulcanisaeta sp.]
MLEEEPVKHFLFLIILEYILKHYSLQYVRELLVLKQALPDLLWGAGYKLKDAAKPILVLWEQGVYQLADVLLLPLIGSPLVSHWFKGLFLV